MAGEIATFRLPKALMQTIMSEAEATGRSRTAVVVEALEQAFNFPARPTASTSVDALHQQLAAMHHQITQLKQQVESQQAVVLDSTLNPLDASSQTLAADQALRSDRSRLASQAAYAQNPDRAVNLSNVSEAVRQASASVSGQGQGNELEKALQHLSVKGEQQVKVLEQVLSASAYHVCMYDRVGRYTYANLAFRHSLGLETTDLYGKTWQELGLPPDSMALCDTKRQFAFATGQSVAAEVSLLTVHGLREYEYLLSPICNVDGTVETVVYTARDVTERKQAAEVSLRESEKNYRNLFEWAPDSIFITDLVTHSLLDVNEHAARRLGYTRKQLLHLPPETISPPMDPQYRKALMRELWQTGSVTFEHFHVCKNGTRISVRISSRVVEYGGQLAIQSFVRDISESTQVQATLDVYRKIVNQVTDAIAILDRDGYYIEQNPAHRSLLGYSDAELEGKTQGFHLRDEDATSSAEALTQMGQFRGDVTTQTKSGAWLRLELSTFVMLNEFGEPSGYVERLHLLNEAQSSENLA